MPSILGPHSALAVIQILNEFLGFKLLKPDLMLKACITVCVSPLLSKSENAEVPNG